MLDHLKRCLLAPASVSLFNWVTSRSNPGLTWIVDLTRIVIHYPGQWYWPSFNPDMEYPKVLC